MLIVIKNHYIFNKHINLAFLPKRSLLFLKGQFGVCLIHMPSLYFYKRNAASFQFLILRKDFFSQFFSSFRTFYRRLTSLFFFKFKLKGLGFRLRKFSSSLYRFYFTKANFIYFHIPPFILVRHKLRRMLLLSNNLALLRTVLVHILLLRRIIPYLIRGIVTPRRLIILKPGKKAF
jgi:hypothetical protein